MHEFSELNRNTGLFSILCFIALFGCFSAIGFIANVVNRFHKDFRKVNSLDEGERAEWTQ
jgi:hypothetical protein